MKIKAEIIKHPQGSTAWHKHRATHLNASELAAAMGISPYLKRSDFIRQRATGVAPEVDAATERRFQQGHEYEAISRPWAEEIINDMLYPTVLAADVEGLPLSVSLDGLTLDNTITFEAKSGNAALLASLETGVIPEHYHPQLEQGLMLSGAERCLFMASSGNREAMRYAWYVSRPELRAQIIPTWQQFLADVAAYEPAEATEPARAEPMASLPTVNVRLDGALSVAGNLPTFAEALRGFIARMPKQPTTDNDFATTEQACKALKKAEEALDAAEAGALASITDVEAMRRAVADCRKLARDTRLAAEKLVERRKVEIKEQAVTAARKALDVHIADLQGELAPMRLQPVAADFAGAIKGLRSIASMQDALDTALAGAKIAADAQARVIRGNVAHFKAHAQGFEFLFADLGQVVHKAAEDFALLVNSRIDHHIRAEQAREAKRQADEAARIAAAEQRAREQEAARLAAEAQAQAEAVRPALTFVAEAVQIQPVAVAANAPTNKATVTALADAEKAPMIELSGAAMSATFTLKGETDPLPKQTLQMLALMSRHELALAVVAHAATAFACKFPSHPKPTQEWWAELRKRLDAVEGAALRDKAA